MPLKTLIPLTILAVFLTGITFGFGLSDLTAPDRYRTVGEREQALANNLRQAQASTNSPAENFRIQANGLARSYITTLAASGRESVRGDQAGSTTSVVDARTSALAAYVGRIIGQPGQGKLSTALQQQTAALVAYARAKGTANGSPEQALSDLSTSTNSLMALLNDLQLSAAVSSSRLSLSQVNLDLRQTIDATAAGNIADALKAEVAGADHFGAFMDTFSTALIARAPTKF